MNQSPTNNLSLIFIFTCNLPPIQSPIQSRQSTYLNLSITPISTSQSLIYQPVNHPYSILSITHLPIIRLLLLQGGSCQSPIQNLSITHISTCQSPTLGGGSTSSSDSSSSLEVSSFLRDDVTILVFCISLSASCFFLISYKK